MSLVTSNPRFVSNSLLRVLRYKLLEQAKNKLTALCIVVVVIIHGAAAAVDVNKSRKRKD